MARRASQLSALWLVLGSCAVAAGCRQRNPAYAVGEEPEDASTAEDLALGAGERLPAEAAAPVDRAGAEAPPPDTAPPETRPPDVPGPAPDAPADLPVSDRPGDLPVSPDRPPDAVRRVVTVACPTDPDLVACFRFEGAVKDESPQALPTMVSGIFYQAGPDGLALNATSATRIQGPDRAALGIVQLTVEAWVLPRSLPTGAERAGIFDYQRQYSLFLVAGGGVRCTVTGLEMVVPGLVKPGAWTSLACTVGGGFLSLWHDGVLKGQRALPADYSPNSFSGGFAVASNYVDPDTSNPDPLDGLLDNVRVWRRARTQQELCAAAISCAP